MNAFQIGTFFDMLSKSQKAYGRRLEPVCKKWELTRSEVDVLLFLYNNPQYDRAADIVTHRGMTKSHVSMSVASLAERGVLERQDSAADRRSAHLRLPEAGVVIAREAREAQLRFLEALFEGISPEEVRMMHRLNLRIFENIDKLNKTE